MIHTFYDNIFQFYAKITRNIFTDVLMYNESTRL